MWSKAVRKGQTHSKKGMENKSNFEEVFTWYILKSPFVATVRVATPHVQCSTYSDLNVIFERVSQG